MQHTRAGSGFLSPPMSANRRRSSVMFNEYVILHTPQPPNADGVPDSRLARCSEKMTQTSDGNIWQVSVPNNIGAQSLQQLSTANLPNSQHSTTTGPIHTARHAKVVADCSDLNIPEAMTCQELLAFSVAFSAALPTGHKTLESFYTSLARSNNNNNNGNHNTNGNAPPTTVASNGNNDDGDNNGVIACRSHFNSASGHCEPVNGNRGNGGVSSGGNNSNVAVLPLSASPAIANHNEDFSCCYELYQGTIVDNEPEMRKQRSKFTITLVMVYHFISKFLGCIQRYVKRMVEHKYFQQGILLAILINTLSMGIEYHDQPPELTVIVETSNVVFSAIFAVEMLLKIVAEGPFRYIANGFNVFDGVIVILRYSEQW